MADGRHEPPQGVQKNGRRAVRWIEDGRAGTGFASGTDGYPSPGRVAWDAWGGDEGAHWVGGIDV